MKSIAKVGAIAFAAGIAGGAVALAGMTKNAIADEAAQRKLALALQNTVGATDKQTAAVERWIAKQGVMLGVTDDELRPAFQRLVQATGSVGEAQRQMGIAMDVSAGTGKSLKVVSEALMKANNGSTASLSKLGLKTKDAEGNTLSLNQALKSMAGTFKGQASAQANTLEGKMTRLKVVFDEAQETIGAKLIPILFRLATWVMNSVVPAVQRLGGFIQSTVVPAVKEFAGQVKTNVLPVVVRFGELIGSKLKPVLDQLVDTVKNQIIPTWKSWLPTIQSIATKVGMFAAGATVLAAAIAGKVLPPIISLVGWLVTFKPLVIGVVAALVAWKVVTIAMTIATAAQAAMTSFWTAAITVNIAVSKAAAVASKAWAAAVWLVNLAMKANPIAKVIAVIALLVAAVVVAYKTSDKFRAIVDKAWSVIKKAVDVAWNQVIKPVLTAWWAYITKVLIPMIKGLWEKVVRPVFSSIGKAISVVWNRVIQPVFKAWQAYLTKVLFPVIKALYEKVIRPIFSSISRTIKTVWESGIKPTFSKLKDGVHAVKDAFRIAVAKIKTFWNGLKEAAAGPVRFVVNTVYNNGIRKVVNAIPGIPGTLNPITMATGGVLPGWSPGRDVHRFVSKTGGILDLAGGESVMIPEWTRQMGGPTAVKRMNWAAKQGNLRKVGDVGAFATGGTLDPRNVGAAQGFATSQQGKPYVWGGVGPGGYDCSGFMSAITNVLRGKYPHSRVGATATFPWAGFKPGPGEFIIGSSPNYGGTGTGHMAGTLIGTNVESSGGVGVRIGVGARGWNDGGFSEAGHLGHGGSSIWGEIIGKVKALWDKLHAAVAKLSNMGEWGGLMKKAVTSIAGGLRDWINGKIPGPGPLPSFDQGGVARGRGSMLKNTIRPERVLTTRQNELLEGILEHVGGRGGMGATVEIGTVNTYDVHAAARAITAEQRKALMIASLA